MNNYWGGEDMLESSRRHTEDKWKGVDRGTN
jgi:hypothetical protein